MELGIRLQTLVDMVKSGQRVADIGCDHAYVSIALAKDKDCSVIAADIKDGPLEIAKENIKAAGMEEKIETRLSDGLTEFKKGEVDAIVIAGMGGHLIVDILKTGGDRLRPGMQLVLSPQSDLRLVRYELRKMNCFIEKEACLSEGGKWYFVLSARVGMDLPMPVSDEEAARNMMYGTYLPEHPSEEFREYLVWEARGLEDLLQSLSKQKTPAAKARQGSLRKQLAENQKIQERLG
ncbi:MAG: SAM-dependent methyltransferase [Eubacterium sp.]|nr:SAM-dependent methyltransferase [Eubacterium sp.]